MNGLTERTIYTYILYSFLAYHFHPFNYNIPFILSIANIQLSMYPHFLFSVYCIQTGFSLQQCLFPYYSCNDLYLSSPGVYGVDTNLAFHMYMKPSLILPMLGNYLLSITVAYVTEIASETRFRHLHNQYCFSHTSRSFNLLPVSHTVRIRLPKQMGSHPNHSGQGRSF